MAIYEEEVIKVFIDTLVEISEILHKNHVKFIVTRIGSIQESEPVDIDLLVSPADYQKTIELFKKNGYDTSSHDKAFGGRIREMQINLVKTLRLKIDLHQDFTWRQSRYFDLEFIWANSQNIKINRANVQLPKESIDSFIVLVNIIFEKTYITKKDFEYLRKTHKEVFNDEAFDKQATTYNWNQTFSWFKNWFREINGQIDFPVFLPIDLVLYSYLEKLTKEHSVHMISFLYYFFFRFRFFINKRLPYS